MASNLRRHIMMQQAGGGDGYLPWLEGEQGKCIRIGSMPRTYCRYTILASRLNNDNCEILRAETSDGSYHYLSFVDGKYHVPSDGRMPYSIPMDGNQHTLKTTSISFGAYINFMLDDVVLQNYLRVLSANQDITIMDNGTRDLRVYGITIGDSSTNIIYELKPYRQNGVNGLINDITGIFYPYEII